MAFFQGFDDVESLGGLDARFDDEGYSSASSVEQLSVELRVLSLLRQGRSLSSSSLLLRREEHETYLRSALEGLSPSFAGLDSSKPWLCYWICHALDLMAAELPPRLATRVQNYLLRCTAKEGGFCGGPQQLPHLAPSYAACLTLATLARTDGFDRVDRTAMYAFLKSLKQPDGSFAMHLDGECDVRSTYCALTVASLLNLLTPEVQRLFVGLCVWEQENLKFAKKKKKKKKLTAGTAEYVLSCQTYEGGFGGAPGNEAHGGFEI